MGKRWTRRKRKHGNGGGKSVELVKGDKEMEKLQCVTMN
jgi:hypothetical protein